MLAPWMSPPRRLRPSKNRLNHSVRTALLSGGASAVNICLRMFSFLKASRCFPVSCFSNLSSSDLLIFSRGICATRTEFSP